MHVYDERTTGMHWQTQKHGAEHFRRARAANPEGRIPVSVAIGTDPATSLGLIALADRPFGPWAAAAWPALADAVLTADG